MQNVTFQRTVTAQINLTPQQWELYASSMDCSEAAEALNRAAEQAIASSTCAQAALKKLFPVLDKYSGFGACDTEPRWVAEKICHEAFGEEC